MENSTVVFGMKYEIATILIPTIVTLTTFITGFLINAYVKKREKKACLFAYRKTIIHWSLSIEDNVIQQIRDCKEFANQLKSNNSIQTEILKYSHFLTKKLSDIDVNDILSSTAYNIKGDENKNIKRSYNIITKLEYFDNIIPKLQQHYNDFVKIISEIQGEWNQKYTEFMDSFTNFGAISSKSENSGSVELYQLIQTNLNKYFSDKSSFSVSEFENEVINPVIAKSVAVIQSDPENINASFFLRKVTSLKQIIYKWKINKSGFSQMFENYSNEMETTYNSLKEDILVLKDCRSKNVIEIK